MLKALTRTAAAILLAAVVQAPADAGTTLSSELVGNFASPIYLTHAPGDETRLFVLERSGRIKIVKNGTTLGTSFLDITSLVSTTFEGGLLGMAFHPDYDSNGYFYVHYTRAGLVSVVRRYQVSSDPDIADSGSAMTLFELSQPASNHNGGWIGFSPINGYLYVAFGDGGFSGSGPQRAQDVTDQWLGKMLRIDVNGDDFPADASKNYAIPPTNPYTTSSGDDEIWDSGLRNPFRCGFDRLTGDLYIGDVGEGSWEEIDFEPASSNGRNNYGWGCMEGNHCLGSFCTCNSSGVKLPIHEYSHSSGCSVSGGTVYRGCAIPDLDGTYFFGDYCSGSIWSLRYDGTTVTDFTNRTSQFGSMGNVVAFGEDAAGELYIVRLNGQVRRIISSTPPADDNNNGIPDSCEKSIPCEGDTNGDAEVNVDDLVAVILDWGCSGACTADVNGDGDVNVDDLVQVILEWGPCP